VTTTKSPIPDIKKVHLTLLTAEQVMGEWCDYVSPCVEMGLHSESKDDPEAYRRFMSHVDLGELGVYIFGGERKDDTSICLGVVIISVSPNPISGKRQMLIWALHAWENVPMELWQAGWDELEILAEDMNCDTIVAHTNVDRVRKILETVNAKQEATVYTKEI
jgi:hypothetical protein